MNNLLYHIVGWEPKRDMNGSAFMIKLFPRWKREVLRSGLNQVKIDNMIEKLGRYWLDGHGYGVKCSFDKTRYLYEPRTSLRVTWGAWGPEHITVPGQACGLDLEMYPNDFLGADMFPHNVDQIYQASLLLTIFLKVADYLVGNITTDFINKESPR